MSKSAYIHIPFCKTKCKYCSFVSFTDLKLQTAYVYSLLKDIETNYGGESLNTLYFGGGSPSLLSETQLFKIINKFKFESNSEITFEVNPSDLSEDYLKMLIDKGITRISLGVQSFNDDILISIGRRHNSSTAINSVNLLNNSGIKNFSVDLIYGLPHQTVNNFKSDLLNLISLEVPHISLYGLKIEKNCFFYENMPKSIPDDDLQADMYIAAVGLLEENGYLHYEISNFAKFGYESKHNLNYWENKSYYGFGVAAHGYIDGIRYYNTSSLDTYIDKPFLHEYGKALTLKEKLQEEIFLGFRKSNGIDVGLINQKYGIDFDEKYRTVLNKYVSANFIEKTKNGYKLKLEGFLLSNIILADFL